MIHGFSLVKRSPRETSGIRELLTLCTISTMEFTRKREKSVKVLLVLFSLWYVMSTHAFFSTFLKDTIHHLFHVWCVLCGCTVKIIKILRTKITNSLTPTLNQWMQSLWTPSVLGILVPGFAKTFHLYNCNPSRLRNITEAVERCED